jgi:hypothetical protein
MATPVSNWHQGHDRHKVAVVVPIRGQRFGRARSLRDSSPEAPPPRPAGIEGEPASGPFRGPPAPESAPSGRGNP